MDVYEKNKTKNLTEVLFNTIQFDNKELCWNVGNAD